jgi:hypothetical protein
MNLQGPRVNIIHLLLCEVAVSMGVWPQGCMPLELNVSTTSSLVFSTLRPILLWTHDGAYAEIILCLKMEMISPLIYWPSQLKTTGSEMGLREKSEMVCGTVNVMTPSLL